MTPPLFSGKTAVFFGDSMTQGFMVANPANRWSSLLSSELGGTEDNRGVGGSGLQPQISTLGCGRAHFELTAVPLKRAEHSYLFLAYGTNDLTVNRPGILSPENFETELGKAITGIVAKGWSAADLVLHTGYWFPNLGAAVGECGVTQAPTRAMAEAYCQATIRAAQQYKTVLADVYHAMLLAPNLSSMSAEGLHINEAGHRFVADFLKQLDYSPATTETETPPAGSFAVRGRLARLV